MTDTPPVRRYLKRAAGLLVNGVTVQVCPYIVKDNVIDGDGLWGDKPFDSLNELVKVAGWSETEASAFLTRLQEILGQR